MTSSWTVLVYGRLIWSGTITYALLSYAYWHFDVWTTLRYRTEDIFKCMNKWSTTDLVWWVGGGNTCWLCICEICLGQRLIINFVPSRLFNKKMRKLVVNAIWNPTPFSKSISVFYKQIILNISLSSVPLHTAYFDFTRSLSTNCRVKIVIIQWPCTIMIRFNQQSKAR